MTSPFPPKYKCDGCGANVKEVNDNGYCPKCAEEAEDDAYMRLALKGVRLG